jgi:hypothetical protein
MTEILEGGCNLRRDPIQGSRTTGAHDGLSRVVPCSQNICLRIAFTSCCTPTLGQSVSHPEPRILCSPCP